MTPEASCTIKFTSENPFIGLPNVRPTTFGYDEVSKHYYWEKILSTRTGIADELLQEARSIVGSNEDRLGVNASVDGKLDIVLRSYGGDSSPGLRLENDLMKFFADYAVVIDIALYSKSYLARASSGSFSIVEDKFRRGMHHNDNGTQIGSSDAIEVRCMIGLLSNTPLEGVLNTEPTEYGHDEGRGYHYWRKKFSLTTYSVHTALDKVMAILCGDVKYTSVRNSPDIELRIFLCVTVGDFVPIFTLSKELLRFYADNAIFIDVDLYS